MTEASFWKKIKPWLQEAGLDPVRVENSAHIGTPDVNYVEGWIELKHTEKRPALDQILRVPHFTQQQRVWLIRRAANEGKCFVLMQVGKSHFLMDGLNAGTYLGNVTMQDIRRLSLFWEGKINKEQLIQALT
jgi:hypothetical protein